MKKGTFCKLETSLTRNFVYNLQTFRGFFQVRKNNCLPTSKHRQAKVHSLPKMLETKRHLHSGRKTVNIQGYSKLREPIKTRENCYSLIW